MRPPAVPGSQGARGRTTGEVITLNPANTMIGLAAGAEPPW
jgi:hypothetical protein